MPTATLTLFKFHKPPLSLKQFMLRSEVLKLYRGFLRLGRLMEPPPSTSTTPPPSPAATDLHQPSTSQSGRDLKKLRNHPLQLEWIDWVRSEFRLRRETTDEEVIRMMLVHGKRQLQEMERTILLATNRNLNATSVSSISNSPCSQKKEKDT